MSQPSNRQFKLAHRPVGMVKRSDFDFVQAPVPQPSPIFRSAPRSS